MEQLQSGVVCLVSTWQWLVVGTPSAVNKFCLGHRVEYTQREWEQCPRCGDTRIEAGEGPDIEGIYAHQLVYCTECHASWTETYTASSRDNYEEGDMG